jgi:indolepyruvate ferredoxin oxidoreductase beta subunit
MRSLHTALQIRRAWREEGGLIMETKNIMIVGVGGQGTLLASKLLGKLLSTKGYDVKVSEVHGMSQRGGNVVTYVRYGDHVYSPIIDKGEADLIISFELLEAARWTRYLKKGGRIVTNLQQINPMPVITGAKEYPADLEKKMRDKGINIDAFDALALAEEAGSSKAVNMVLMGKVSNYFDFSEETWLEAIEHSVKEKFIDMNKKAFHLGRRA